MGKDELFKKATIYLNEMDFIGQQKTEKYYKIIITLVAVVSFIVSLFQKRFSTCVYSTLIACFVCLVLFVPGWPIWKRNQLSWVADAKKAA